MFLAQPRKSLGNSNRGDGYPCGRQVEAIPVSHYADSAEDILIVVQGLADPHEYDTIYFRTQLDDLLDNLRGIQVPLETSLSGRTELAGECAADLR